jgi:hypothetical protein
MSTDLFNSHAPVYDVRRRESNLSVAEWKPRLDAAAHLAGLAVVLVYVAGFIVITFRDSSYGVVESSLFRGRILSAGILFFVFLVLPMVERLKSFNLFPFKQTDINSDGPVNSHRLSFFLAAWVTSILMTGYFLDAWDFRNRAIAIYFLVPAFATCPPVYEKLRHKRPAKISHLLLLSVLAVGIGGLVYLRDWRTLALLAWFSIVGALGHGLHSIVTEPKKLLRTTNWFWVLLYILGTIGTFARYFYPNVHPEFGGGKPPKVIMQFVSTSPIDGSNKTSVWLANEVEDGCYVLQAPEDAKAVYIPRQAVAAIYFAADSK